MDSSTTGAASTAETTSRCRAAACSASAADGAVAFTSASSNLVDSDTNGAGDVFVQRLEPNGPYPYSSDLAAGLQTAFGSNGGYAAPELDIADGTTVPAMGIQGSDGARARAQVRQLRALVHSLTR